VSGWVDVLFCVEWLTCFLSDSETHKLTRSLTRALIAHSRPAEARRTILKHFPRDLFHFSALACVLSLRNEVHQPGIEPGHIDGNDVFYH
jgi:hypothetical protein